MIRLTLFTLAHQAYFSEPGSLLNIGGIYSGLTASAFPFTVPRLLLVARFTGSPTDYEREFEVMITFTDQDGLPGPIPSERRRLHMKIGQSGEDIHHNFLHEIYDTTFTKPGWYQFSIHVDGEVVEELPFNVSKSVRKNLP